MSGRRIRPAPRNGAQLVDQALRHIGNAQKLLARADCPRARAALRAARKSVEGAERHMRHRLARQLRAGDRR